MKERLRAARKAMHDRFPFSEGLWLEWIANERAAAKANADYIIELYELAVKDYLSIQLWLDYLQ